MSDSSPTSLIIVEAQIDLTIVSNQVILQNEVKWRESFKKPTRPLNWHNSIPLYRDTLTSDARSMS